MAVRFPIGERVDCAEAGLMTGAGVELGESGRDDDRHSVLGRCGGDARRGLAGEGLSVEFPFAGDDELRLREQLGEPDELTDQLEPGASLCTEQRQCGESTPPAAPAPGASRLAAANSRGPAAQACLEDSDSHRVGALLRGEYRRCALGAEQGIRDICREEYLRFCDPRI